MTPTITLTPILSVDQSAAVASYLRGQSAKPTGLPDGYILPNGEPANAGGTPMGPLPSASAPSKPFPWVWVAVGLLGVGALVVLMRRRQ